MQVNKFINLITHIHDLSHIYMSMKRASSIDEVLYFHHYKSLLNIALFTYSNYYNIFFTFPRTHSRHCMLYREKSPPRDVLDITDP